MVAAEVTAAAAADMVTAEAAGMATATATATPTNDTNAETVEEETRKIMVSNVKRRYLAC